MVRLRSPAPYWGDFPSGQRGQTVNLLSLTSVVRIHHPPPSKNHCICSGFLLGGEIDGEAADARTKRVVPRPLCWWFLPPSEARMWSRIHHPPPEKSTCVSKCFFQRNSFLAERVKYAVACEIAWGSEIRLRRVRNEFHFTFCEANGGATYFTIHLVLFPVANQIYHPHPHGWFYFSPLNSIQPIRPP